MAKVLKMPDGSSTLNALGGGMEIHSTHGSYTLLSVILNKSYDSGLDYSTALQTYLNRPSVKQVNRDQHRRFLTERHPFLVAHDFVSGTVTINGGIAEDEEDAGLFIPKLKSNDSGKSRVMRYEPLKADSSDWYSPYPVETAFSSGYPGGVLYTVSPSQVSMTDVIKDIAKTSAVKYIGYGASWMAQPNVGAWPIHTSYSSQAIASGTNVEKLAWLDANFGELRTYAETLSGALLDDFKVDRAITPILWLKDIFSYSSAGSPLGRQGVNGIAVSDLVRAGTNFTIWLIGDADQEKVFSSVPHTGSHYIAGISRYIGVPVVNIGCYFMTGSTSRSTVQALKFDPTKPAVAFDGTTVRGTMFSSSWIFGQVDYALNAASAFNSSSVVNSAWIQANLGALSSMNANLPDVLTRAVSAVGIGRTAPFQDSVRYYSRTKSLCLPLGVVERIITMSTDFSVDVDGTLSGDVSIIRTAVKGESLIQRMGQLYLEYNDNKFDAAYNDIQSKAVQLNGRYVRSTIFESRYNDPGSVLLTRVASDWDKGKKESDPLFKDQLLSGSNTIGSLDSKRPGFIGGFSLLTTFAGEYERALSTAAQTLLASPGGITIRVRRGSNDLVLSSAVAGVTDDDLSLLFLKGFALSNGGDEVTYLSTAEAAALRSEQLVEFEVDEPKITKYGMQAYDLGATRYPPLAPDGDIDVARRQYFVFGTLMNELTNQVILMTLQDKSLQVA